jgi:hypothetical protein
MKSIKEIFGRDDFDSKSIQAISDVTQECASTFGEPIVGYTQVLSTAKEQPMSIWFVVADQLVRMHHGKPGTKWPIESLHGSISSTNDTKTLTISQEGGGMALAIMALDKRNVASLDRFLRFLEDRGLDVTGSDGVMAQR